MILLNLAVTAIAFAVFPSQGSNEVRSITDAADVRAVYLDCSFQGCNQKHMHEELSSFQREEMYRHSSLQDCAKKLAVTVRLYSDPEKGLEEEYIPIDHVMEGAHNRRLRLLDPYVLRLRREPVLEAYQLTYWKTQAVQNEHQSEKSIENTSESIPYRKRDTSQENELSSNNEKLNTMNLYTSNSEGIAKHTIRNSEYDLYRISAPPSLWNTIRVQLFKKSNTNDGTFYWDDLTGGEIASVGPDNPKWEGQDTTVQYKIIDWINEMDFTFPQTHIIVVPKPESEPRNYLSQERSFAIVPNENINNMQLSNIVFDKEKKMKLVNKNSKQYLTVPHGKPINIELSVEVRADDNQVVKPGASGRISTVVADSSSPSGRPVINVFATNTGLASARYRVLAKDCIPDPLGVTNVSVFESEPADLLPPHCTRKFTIAMPDVITEYSGAVTCSAILLNEDDDYIAMRDVKIKRNDICSCVWNCECVCYGDDPKLICQEMPLEKVCAAGLKAHPAAPRIIRSIYYKDYLSVDVIIAIVGVMISLLFLGVIKAVAGLCFTCIGKYGLDLMLEMPRPLTRYYEHSLKRRAVVYDDEGWPVHPDTRERNVRCVSRPIEFILNMIFFLILPSLVVKDVLKQAFRKETRKSPPKKTPRSPRASKKLKGKIREVFKRNKHNKGSRKGNDKHNIDSEPEDTQYVISAMRQSRESIEKLNQEPGICNASRN